MKNNLKLKIKLQSFMISLLFVLVVLNTVWAFQNPTEVKYYGWICVSICFIIFNVLNRKANIKELKKLN